MKYLLPILLLTGCAPQSLDHTIAVIQAPKVVKVDCYDKNNKLLSTTNSNKIVFEDKESNEPSYCLISQI